MTSAKSRRGNYMPVHYNAAKHGILSRHAVLPHEDKAEFQALLSALIDEYSPTSPTEMHLVEEMACTMWRKRRVLQAEYADINKNLVRVTQSPHNLLVSATPLQHALWDNGADLALMLEISPEEAAQQNQEAWQEALKAHDALMGLESAHTNSYQTALATLPEEWKNAWHNFAQEETIPETAAALEAFIKLHMIPVVMQAYREGKHHAAAKAQTWGETLRADRLESLVRYETSLDRKFERTLAMLLKLKEIRAPTNSE